MLLTTDFSNRLFAALAALAISAAFMATAIVPATPGLELLA